MTPQEVLEQAPAPRLRLPWLVALLVAALALGVIRREADVGEVWQLAASGAGATAFLALFAKSFGLLKLKAEEPQP